MMRMDEAAEARFVKIENLLSAFMETLVAGAVAAQRRQEEWARNQAEWAKNQADWEKRQAEWEKRQDRLDRRVHLFARAGLAEVRRNRKEHAVFDERMDSVSKNLDKVTLNLAELTDKLNAIIKIEQDRQPPQQ